MYYIDGEAFETEDEAFYYFIDSLDFTDGSTLDKLCEKMEYTKEELLGTILFLALRKKLLIIFPKGFWMQQRKFFKKK